MSATILRTLNLKSASPFREFPNGYGSGPLAWDYLTSKYGDPDLPRSERVDMVEKLCHDMRLEHDERLVLYLTFERSFVPLDKLSEAAEGCETFSARIPWKGRENHWAAIGEGMREMAVSKLSKFARGACLTLSTNEDGWHSYKDWPSRAWSVYRQD